MSKPLEEIYEKYKKQIYYYLYKSTFNHHIAEELTQETFLKAFKGFKKFRKESSIKTWLYVIARNTYLNYSNKHKNQLEENIDTVSQDILDPSDDFKSTNESILIKRVLMELPEKHRTLLILRGKNSLSYREISNILEISEGQVKIGLHRGRKKFREIYRKYEED